MTPEQYKAMDMALDVLQTLYLYMPPIYTNKVDVVIEALFEELSEPPPEGYNPLFLMKEDDSFLDLEKEDDGFIDF